MRDIGKNIKQLRVQKKMTQDDLAENLFVTRQTVSNYETGKSRPDIDMLVKIAEALDTDIQTVIYGPETEKLKPELLRLIAGGALAAVLGILWAVLTPIAKELMRSTFSISLNFFLYMLVGPLCCLFAGWTAAHLIGMALRKQPLQGKWVRRIGVILLVLVILWFVLSVLYVGMQLLDEWLYYNHIRGEWVETWIETEDGGYFSEGWSRLPLPGIEWLERYFAYFVFMAAYKMSIPYPVMMLLPGAALWLLGIPGCRKKKQEP